MRWKNEKNAPRYYHFTLVYHKIWSNDVRVLKYQVRQTEVFVNLGYFLPFYPTNNLKNQNFEKIKVAWRYHHFQMKIIWYMVLEIWSVTDRSFCHFGLLFALLPLPPNPMKKTLGDIIILHMWTINENHMMYDTWDMEWDTQIFFLILDNFYCLFTPLTTHKIKIFNKWKKPLEIHKCTINDNNIMYSSWYMEHDWENFFVILDYFLPFYPTNNPKNRNFEKMKKPPGDIIILHKCT